MENSLGNEVPGRQAIGFGSILAAFAGVIMNRFNAFIINFGCN